MLYLHFSCPKAKSVVVILYICYSELCRMLMDMMPQALSRLSQPGKDPVSLKALSSLNHIVDMPHFFL